MGSHVRFKSKIGALITEARAKHKLSQREVSVLLGMNADDQAIVSAWERGWRPVRVDGAAKTALLDLLSVTPSELDVLLRESETARARAITRRRAKQAVRRQYEAPTPLNPVKPKRPAAKTVAVRPPETIHKVRDEIRSTDTVAMIVTAIAGNDPALTGTDSDALVRLVRRFLAVQKALVSL